MPDVCPYCEESKALYRRRDTEEHACIECLIEREIDRTVIDIFEDFSKRLRDGWDKMSH